jgi:hypothetical protein
LALALGFAALILVYRFLPPVSTLMLARWPKARLSSARIPLQRISGFLRAAAIVSRTRALRA